MQNIKLYPSCTGDFYDCGLDHHGINLDIRSFLKEQDRDIFFDKLKKLIETELSPEIVEWVYLASTSGHHGNATSESFTWPNVKDPTGNRDENAKPFEVKEK